MAAFDVLVVLYYLIPILLYGVVIFIGLLYVMSIILNRLLRINSPYFYIFILILSTVFTLWLWSQDHHSSIIIFIVTLSIWVSRQYIMPAIDKATDAFKYCPDIKAKRRVEVLENFSVFVTFVQMCVVGMVVFW